MNLNGLSCWWRSLILSSARRRNAAQRVFGTPTPPLLVTHIVCTRIAWRVYGVEDAYSRVALLLWALAPGSTRPRPMATAWRSPFPVSLWESLPGTCNSPFTAEPI